MADLESEGTGGREARELSHLEKLVSCTLYFVMSLLIFVVPFYVYLPRLAIIPFYVLGGMFLYASTVSLLIHLAEYAAGSSKWDRNGLITVASFWCCGLLLALGPMYFGTSGGWRSAFYYPAAFVLLVGLAGSIHELAKRESKGAGWYWLPGVGWLTAALSLHIVRTRVNMWTVFETVVGIGVLFCLLGAVFFLVPIILYRLPTPRPRTKCWKPGLRTIFKKSPKRDASMVLDELHTDVSVVAYRLMIMLFLFSIAMVVFFGVRS